MRTTLDIDDDVLEAAKSLAELRKSTAGKVLSDLAREALKPSSFGKKFQTRNGVPLIPVKPGGTMITMEMVNRMRDEE